MWVYFAYAKAPAPIPSPLGVCFQSPTTNYASCTLRGGKVLIFVGLGGRPSIALLTRIWVELDDVIPQPVMARIRIYVSARSSSARALSLFHASCYAHCVFFSMCYIQKLK